MAKVETGSSLGQGASSPTAKASAINIFFIAFLAGGVCYASWTGQMKSVADQSVEAAKSAVALAVDLIGIMAFWLGLFQAL